MTLWNIIRDFFVEYIFGGMTSEGVSFQNYLGLFGNNNYELGDGNTGGIMLPVNTINSDLEAVSSYISFGDWLSTTATIITLCAICVFLFFFVRWLFRLTAGLVSGRG